ncbi:MAG: hypothetical protein M1813_003013 [Trichoglossum hirsutum]|jgi:urease accessory protein|nr:MAG: hypothetical protein M1813_003013 [Trichoglossum hirsutum]
MVDEEVDPQTLRNEIAGLEKRLQDAKATLKRKTIALLESKDEDLTGTGTAHDASDEYKEGSPSAVVGTTAREHTSRLSRPRGEAGKPTTPTTTAPPSLEPTQHALLLLSDSALPLGSFAFSSGLESYLAHHHRHHRQKRHDNVQRFLRLSLSSVAASALPYVLAAFRDPARLPALDTCFDASTPCAVARRASAAQGRALLAVWERAFRDAGDGEEGPGGARGVLDAFRVAFRASSSTEVGAAALDGVGGGDVLNGHFPPLWGCVSRAMGLSLPQTAYVFLFNHAKAVLSAGVRAGVMGPYQAHGVLAAAWLRESVRDAMERSWEVDVEDAGQVVPVLDLYQGRHELLYSRIFNS